MPTLQDLQFIHNRRDFQSQQPTYIRQDVAPPQPVMQITDVLATFPDRQIPLEKTSIDTFEVRQFIRGGATNYDEGTGWWIGHNGTGYRFFIGNSAGDKLTWDGTNLTITGALIAGEIHIPDEDTTANSFHVSSTGNMWIGATSTNFTADNENAQVYFLATGVGFIRNTLQVGTTTGSYITIDGANERIRSSNYVTGVSGFTVEPGLLEAQNILARGTLSGTVFRYDVISATGGRQIIANADALSTAMTALDASTLTIRGNITLAVNDILIIRAQSSGGIQEEYLRITATGSAPTYSVTRDLAGTYGADLNPAWPAGTVVVQQGVSDGAAAFSGGWLELVGEASSGSDWPRISVFQRTAVAYNGFTERVRIGNLNGYLGYVADTFGVGIGSSVAGEANITFDATNGIRIRQGTTNRISLDMAGAATLFALNVEGSLNVFTSGNLRSGQTAYNTGTGYFMEYNAGTPRFSIGDATAGNSLTWDGTTLRVNGRTFATAPEFGDGSDGDATIAGNTTITRDMFYDDLTINATFTLNTGGYKVFVLGTLTVNGTIGRPGTTGSAGGAGVNGGAGSPEIGGAGGAGGGGTSLASGSLYGSVAWPSGSTGGTGGAGANDASGAAGSNSAANSSGTNAVSALGAAPSAGGVQGANAGKGGDSVMNPARVGGAGGSSGALTGSLGTVTIPQASVRNLGNALLGIDTGQVPPRFYQGSASGVSCTGGGGGGGGGAVNGGSVPRAGGGGGGGGGGAPGGNGGICLIAARTIVVDAAGIITVAGGTGGAGGVGGNGADAIAPAGSDGGGGGGGGGGAGGDRGCGGVLILVYQSLTNDGSITAALGSAGSGGAGGSGGNGAGGAQNGDAGSTGSPGLAGSGIAGVIIQLQRI